MKTTVLTAALAAMLATGAFAQEPGDVRTPSNMLSQGWQTISRNIQAAGQRIGSWVHDNYVSSDRYDDSFGPETSRAQVGVSSLAQRYRNGTIDSDTYSRGLALQMGASPKAIAKLRERGALKNSPLSSVARSSGPSGGDNDHPSTPHGAQRTR